MNSERQIEEAYDRISKKILKASEIFKNSKLAFEVRVKRAKAEYDLECLECKQDIAISYSSNDILYFKHLPNANPCLLLNSKLKEKEKQEFFKIYRTRESNRHKSLKNTLGKKLRALSTTQNVFIDDRFIKDEYERRKPDVYCELNGTRIAFEIQLSVLSLKYIVSRHEFYKRNGISLIWILDDFNIHGQTQTERDIKYLTEYQNFFSFDEEAVAFRLKCTYKYVSLNDTQVIKSVWITKSVALSQLKFDPITKQPFFYNYGLKLRQMQLLRDRRINELKAKRIKDERIEKENKSFALVKTLEDEIRRVWKSEVPSMARAQLLMQELDEFEQDLFAKSSLFVSDDKGSRIHYYFQYAKNKHFNFLDFIINSQFIEIELNEKSIDNKTIIQTLMNNKSLWNKYGHIKRLVQAGYNPKSIDYELIKTIPNKKKIPQLIVGCEVACLVENPIFRAKIFENIALICIMESIKRNKIVGFRWKESQWIDFVNNAIHSYPKFWNHISKALKAYELWDFIVEKDINATFQKKMSEHNLSNPTYFGELDYVLYALYPEAVKNPNRPLF